jgi:deoxyribodipyrimidine photo-lyase
VNAFGVPAHLQHFEPSREAAIERMQRLHPGRYAKTRNHLDGAVSGLSPYITHGFVSLAEIVHSVAMRHALSFVDKLVAEFAWREFFHHVWLTQQDGIFADMRARGWLSGSTAINYSESLPPDVREARTGIAAIDSAVRVLYGTGYLHNHARMWLASYLVHFRKVSWRAGADWMYGHLLDGDLACNHLSWQWVAGTFSHKPYLFNADNVAKYAPATAAKHWESFGTGIDLPYDAIEALAHSPHAVAPERTAALGTAEPPLLAAPPGAHWFDAGVLDGKAVELVHPWALGPRPEDDGTPDSAQTPRMTRSSCRLGVLHLPFHLAFPWSERRYQFVMTRMQAVCDAVFVGDLTQLAPALARAAQVRAQATLNPHYRDALAAIARLMPQAAWLPQPSKPCDSFSKFYERVQRDAAKTGGLSALLGRDVADGADSQAAQTPQAMQRVLPF